LENKTSKRILDNWDEYENDTYSLTPPLPETLMIEVTNACNLKCTMCRNPEMQRKTGRISFELLEKILVQAKDAGVRNIALYTTGEPLMHPRIYEIIERVKAAGFYAYLTTNALLLDEERIQRLLSTGIDSIKYSLDGLNKQEYESIRIQGDYDKLMEILSLLKNQRDRTAPDVKLLMGVILAKYNIRDKEKYIQRYGDMVDEIIFSLISNQAGFISSDNYAEIKPDEIRVSTEFKACRQLWDRLVVTYDGKLVACCIDFEAELEYGDLSRQSLAEAWNSEQMLRLRRAHKERDLAGYPLCHGCDSPYIQQVEVFKQLNE